MPRRPHPSTMIALAGAAVAAGLLVAVPVVTAGRLNGSPRSIAAAEPGARAAAHAHPLARLTTRADRRRRVLCARPAYRRRHLARCPSPRAFPRSSRGIRAAEAVPAADGRWAPPVAVPTSAIHAILLPTGKVLWLSKRASESAGGEAFLHDPAEGTTRAVPPPDVPYPDGSVAPANLFCSGHAQLADGRILVAGGNLAYRRSNEPGESWKGSRWLFTFNPWTETWTRQATDMAGGRWYPTVTTLPDGRALITGGWDESGNDVSNDDLEVFTPSADPDGADGSVAKVGTRPWAQLYPHMFVVPATTAAGAGSVRVVMTGPAGRYPANAAVLDTATWQWRGVPFLPTNREFGAAVLLPGGPDGPRRVMVTGGADTPTDPTATRTTAVLDLADPGAGFTPGPPLVTPRTHVNTVLLPDGSVLAVGGGSGSSDASSGGVYAGPVYRSEILDPGADSFRPVDTQQVERTYHSTALLLPDGRVLSAGDDRPTHAAYRTAETYSPPYLFRGSRPVVTFAPRAARYDADIHVATPSPETIAGAVLIRPASVTHATDMDQRSIAMDLAVEPGGVTLRTPRDGTIAPPGYYMLFLLDREGVPSVARWLRLDPSAPPAPGLPSVGGPRSSVVPPGAARPPDAAGPSPAPAPGDPRPVTGDTRAPRVAVVAVARRTRRGLVVRVTLRADEVSRARVRAVHGGRSVVTSVRLAPRRTRTATLPMPAAPTRGPLHVVVRATDAAGNVTRTARTVRLPAPRRVSSGG